MERHYLSAVEYEGRGQKQQLTYRFADLDALAASAVPDGPLIAELARHRVSAAVARRLVVEYGEDHVRRRLEKFRRLLDGGYKARNRSAVLVDVIRDQDNKYPESTAEAGGERRAAAASYMPTLVEATDDPQPLEAQVDAALKTLQFLLRER